MGGVGAEAALQHLGVDDGWVQRHGGHAGGEFLGRFRDDVYSGEVDVDPNGNQTPATTLDVDQSGTFNACTTVPFGMAARVDCRTEFTVIEEE